MVGPSRARADDFSARLVNFCGKGHKVHTYKQLELLSLELFNKIIALNQKISFNFSNLLALWSIEFWGQLDMFLLK